MNNFLSNNKYTSVSNITIYDKKNLIDIINDYKICKRDLLYFPYYITFGLEYEYEYGDFTKIKNNINYLKRYNKIKYNYSFSADESVTKKDGNNYKGGEFVSPILHDSVDTWNDTENICKAIKNENGKATSKCGGHIHIGSNIFGENKDYWMNLVKMWTIYEDVLFRFGWGMETMPRPEIIFYAKSIRNFGLNKIKLLEKDSKSFMDIIETFKTEKEFKYNSLNFNNIEEDVSTGHLEVRIPNGTLNPAIWQNNINLFSKFMLYAASNNCDTEFLDYNLNKQHPIKSFEEYNRLNLEKAIELGLLLFDNKALNQIENETDFLNFMKQYLNHDNKYKRLQNKIKTLSL